MCGPTTSRLPCSLECSTRLMILATMLSGTQISCCLRVWQALQAAACRPPLETHCAVLQGSSSWSAAAGQDRRVCMWPAHCAVKPASCRPVCSCHGHLHPAVHQLHTEATPSAEWCFVGGLVQTQYCVLKQTLSYCLDVAHAGGQRDCSTLLAWALTTLQRAVVTPIIMAKM